VAEQAVKPAVSQLRVPAQVAVWAPGAVERHEVDFLAAMAPALHVHCWELGTHCRATPPSRICVSLQPNAGGQSLSASQLGAQNQPLAPLAPSIAAHLLP
jgi:hypothetical protein